MNKVFDARLAWRIFLLSPLLCLTLGSCQKKLTQRETIPTWVPAHNVSITRAPQFMYVIIPDDDPRVALWIYLEKRGNEAIPMAGYMDVRDEVENCFFELNGIKEHDRDRPLSMSALFDYSEDGNDLTVTLMGDSGVENHQVIRVPSIPDVPHSENNEAIMDLLRPSIEASPHWHLMNHSFVSAHVASTSYRKK